MQNTEEINRMTNRFMVSVAALALIAGTGFANAQGSMKSESGGGSTMQHSAPSSGSATSSQPGSTTGQSSTESSQSEQKSPGGAMSNQRAEEHNKSGTTSQRAEERNKGTETNQRAEERNKGTETNQRAEERNKGTETSQRAEERNKGTESNMKAQGRTGSSTMTTGQAGAGAKLSSDQRTKISTVIRGEHVKSVDHVNFAVTVGTRVPREGIDLRPLPAEVVTIYPEWRGYDFIVVHDQIVVIDPGTYEIVEIIES
jgi:hypothetical protein